MRCVRFVREWKSALIGTLCFTLPLPLLFIPFTPDTSVRRAAYLLALMSSLWALTPVSIYVTAFVPLVAIPVLQIMGANATAAAYFNDAILLFVGSFMLTAAMERWLLHKRIALRIVLLLGNRPRLILLGVMVLTGSLSCWMSNTATTALMVPLVLPIIAQLQEEAATSTSSSSSGTKSIDGEETSLEEGIDVPMVANSGDAAALQEPEEATQCDVEARRLAAETYCKSLLLGVAYCASLGGISTLVGTGPNLVLVQMMMTLFPNFGGISFGAWMLFAVPIASVCIGCLWAFFVFVFNRRGMHLVRFDVSSYEEEYIKLGSNMSQEEWIVSIIAISMAVLWLTRSGIPPVIPGWGVLFNGKVQDGTVCICLGMLLFVIPSRRVNGSTLLEVSAISRELHWEVILLLGAGFALASALVVSGLTLFIGKLFAELRVVPVYLVVLCLTFVGSFWTEVCSNVATANILNPLAGALAVALGQNPLLLMVPVTLACSLAFMLPVATPPNAMVMAAGILKPGDMMRVGFFLNLLGVFLISGWIFVGGRVLGIHVHELPDWAVNVTRVV